VTSALSNPDAELTFAPGLPYEGTLNGIPLKSWDAPKTPEEWNAVEGQNKSLVEPPMPQSYKKQASGCVIIEPDGRVWTVEPTNHFGGHDRVFPKGKLDEGLSLQANAIKEAHEEAGLKVKITGHLGDYERADSITRYYKAERVGGNPADAHWETQGIRLSKPDQLDKHMGEQGELLSDVKSGGSGFVRMMPVQPKVWQSNTPKWWTDPIKFSTSVPLVTPTTPKPVAPKPTIKTTTTIEKPDRKKRLIVFKKKESVDGMDELIRTLEGGSGSGNFGHKGRKGKVGGSLPGGGKSGDIAYSKHAEFPQKPYFKPEGGKFIHGPSGISIERGVDGWVAKGGSLPDGEMSAKSKQALVDAIVAANNASNGAILAKKGDKTPVKTLDKTPEKKAEKTPDEEHIGIPKNEPLLHKGLLNPDLDATIAKLEEGDAKLKALREKHDQATKAYWDKYKEIEKQADDFDVDHEKAEVELKALSAANHIAYQAANDFEDKLKEIVKLEHSIEVTFKGEGTVTPKQNKMQIAAGDWLGEHMVDGVMPSKDIKIAWSKDTKRANYDFKRINTGNDSWDRTIVHETGHYIEHKNTTVRETINEFLGRRTKKEIAVPMNGTTYTSIGTPGSSPAKSKGYDSSEITRPDKFYHPYVGKVYGGSGAFRPSEVLSMGLEAMRTSPAAFLRADPEHFRLTLAIMRGYIQ
jgi:ADP-ribose pyrophosphatase YjhB (NUDIX family)